MVFSTNDKWRGDLNTVLAQTSQAICGLLKKAFIAREAQKLFGETRARQRPQTCARAAAKNDGCDLNHDFQINLCLGRQVDLFAGFDQQKGDGRAPVVTNHAGINSDIPQSKSQKHKH